MTITRIEKPYNRPNGLRVLICGGRKFNDAMTFGSWVGGVMKTYGISAIIEGGASGADFMASEFGRWAGVPVVTYPADWKQHGRAAGPIRNQHMIDDGRPDLVLAFDGGRGTADMIGRAEKAGIRVMRCTKVTIQ